MKRETRKLTDAEKAVIEVLYHRKNESKTTDGFVTAAQPIPMGGSGNGGPWNNPTRIIPVGRTLKIVMVSRFGDAGLTDDLDADYGYEVRLDWEDAAMSDIRLTKEPTKNS